MPRVEDEALLRGEGRFLDDLAPVAHAVPRRDRALAARARADRGRRDRRARAPGRRRRPHRRRRRRAVAPVPGRDRQRRRRTTRPRSTPCATSASRSPSSSPRPLPRRGRGRARRGRLRAARARARPGRSGRGAVHDRSFSYGDVDAALAAADLVVRGTLPLPALDLHARSSATASSPTGTRPPGALTAWANFQGPFTLHGVAAAALGLPGDRLRLLTPPDSGGSFGIKSAVFAYVVLIGLASRQLGVPVRWTEDRLEHLAASAASTGRIDRGRGGLHAPTASCSRSATTRSRTSARTSARPSRRRSTGCTARSPAPTASRTSPRGTASCSRTRCPSGLNRGFGGPQLYLGARADDGDRRRGGSGSTRPSSPAATSSPPTRCPTARRRGRSTTPATTRPASTTRSSSPATTSCARGSTRARADGRLAGIGLACVVEPSISNMGYITLAQTADERAAGAAEVGQRRGRVDRDRPARRDHGAARDDAAGAGPPRPSARRSSPTCSAATPEDVDGAVRDGHGERAVDASPRATTRRASRASRVGAVQAAALKLRAKIDAIRAHAGDETLSLRRVAGMAHWNPEALPRARSRARRGRVLGAAEPRPAGRGGPRRLVGRARLHRRRLRGRGRRARRARCACSTTSPSTTPAGSSTRCSPTGRCSAASPTASRAALFERARLRRVGQPDDRLVRRLPRPDGARHAGAADRAPCRRRRRSPRSARRGSARGTR